MIVAAPHEPALEVADFFLNELAKRKMDTPVVIANQCHMAKYDDLDPQALLSNMAKDCSKGLQEHTDSTLLARMKTAHKRLRNLSKEEERLLALLLTKLNAHQKLFRIPRFHGEVHDIHALKRVGDVLLNQE